MRDYSLKCCPQNHIYPIHHDNCIRREIENDYTKLCQLNNKTKMCKTNLCCFSEPKEIEPIFHEKCAPLHHIKAKLISKDKNDNVFRNRMNDRKLAKLKRIESDKNLKKYQNTQKGKTCKSKHLKKKCQKEILQKQLKPPTEVSKLKSLKEAYASKLQNRIKLLSKPKKYPEYKPKTWVLTKALKHYKPTRRLCELAKPKMYYNNDYKDPFKVPEKALSYQATLRIQELAKPNNINHKILQEAKKKNPFKIKPKALRAIATQRIKELATPKDYYNIHIRANPYKVSRLALKAKASARVKQLAQPKTSAK
ncbi:uncharacterized protein LOC119605606 isoform X1 [Lucilia sericata]|uniref:uncharacterized protein LOC119605606 isoform X1 n=1 Tax=Lucilia sericata TaxID=13632 RepID=UPI0018A80888|nr:uncharacterized protein LOC119605606 isoform X1 [Lucilia sericata]